MSKITNDGLTPSGTRCCIHIATVGVKGLINKLNSDTQPHATHKTGKKSPLKGLTITVKQHVASHIIAKSTV